jgi:hypothetical protein
MTDLTGRFVVLDSSEGDYYTVSQFLERLGEHLYLMQSYSPHALTLLRDGLFIFDLTAFALDPDDVSWPRARIFMDRKELLAFTNEIHSSPKEVVKLVRPKT